MEMLGTRFAASVCCVMLILLNRTSAQGLTIELKGHTYANNAEILITEVGEDSNAVLCRTDRTDCCGNEPGEARQGEWFYPNNTRVGTYYSGYYSGGAFYRNRGTGIVKLNRRYGATQPTGLYCCQVATMADPNAGICINLDTVPLVTLHESHIPNHGMISVNDLAIGGELSCKATTGECCSLFPHLSNEARLGTAPSGIGSWRYPNGSYVRPTLSSDSYGIVRHHGRVDLHRQSSHTAEGLWRCEAPRSSGIIDSIYLGIYSPGRGILSVSENIYISRVVSLDPLEVVLACETTGGPATTVIWRRNGFLLHTRQSQVVLNNEESIYMNEIMVSGLRYIAGVYSFYVSNAVSTNTSNFDISGVTLLHNGRSVVANNSIIDLPTGATLLCSTDNEICCQSNAFWRSPRGISSSDVFSVRIGTALLYMERTSRPFQAHHSGMWHCTIPDRQDVIHTVYVGIYTQSRGIVTLNEGVQFSVIREDQLVFMLSCTTTGGPATTVQWTRNGVTLANGGRYTMTQIILNTQTATYENRLTVSGRVLGFFGVSVSNSRTSSPVQSQYNVTVEAPPTSLALSLFSADGITVSWTPATSADSSSLYVIHYSTSNVPQQVSVSALAASYTLRGLVFGGVYSISMAGLSDFESGRIGPKSIKIGIPDVPESIRAVPRVTSLQLSWSPPSQYHGPITHYQVSYHCADNAVTSNTSTGTTWTLTGLKPRTTCLMQVRTHTLAGAGEYSNSVTTTTTSLSMVEDVRVEEVLDGSTVRLTWDPVVLHEWEVDHYTIYYTTFSTSRNTGVYQRTVLTPHTAEVFSLTHIDPKFEHWFQVTVSIEVEGEEFESQKSTLTIFSFDSRLFQLHLSPVENCASWDVDKVNWIEYNLHLALIEAITESCNCSFSAKFIRAGKFRCWNSPSEVTYRSSVVGAAGHNSSQVIGYIESWVRSKVATVDVGQISLQVLSSECAVRLSTLSEGECGSKMKLGRAQTLSLVSQDTATIQCVQSCLLQQGNSTCGN